MKGKENSMNSNAYNLYVHEDEYIIDHIGCDSKEGLKEKMIESYRKIFGRKPCRSSVEGFLTYGKLNCCKNGLRYDFEY